VFAEGAVAGLIGYGAIVLFFVVVNVFAGRSIFYTAALFGSALFYGLRDPASLEMAIAPVASYNMVHLLVFLSLGVLAAWIVSKMEKFPLLLLPVLLAIFFVAAYVIMALVIFAEPLLGGVAWWQLGASSVLAAVLMGWYLFRRHPGLRREFADITHSDVSA
jgi:hypothetical protein